MAASIIAAGAIWRPHCKAIRSPSIAKMLVDGGAVGITCAKVSQAAAMVSAGVKDVLIANEIVGHKKVAAMISLIPRMDRLCVACDDESNLRMISAEAEALGVTIGVLIDMNIGMNRCGIHWSKKDEIIAMSHLAEKLPGIEYRGLMGYEGHAQGVDKKDELSQLVADRLGSAKKWVEDSGLKVPLVSGSGSGNYFVSKDLGTTNEIQAGGGVLHCMQYATSMNGHDKEPDHRNSIQLACQIISLAGFDEGRAIGDAGFKTMFPSGVLPWVALVAFHVLRAQAAMYDSCHRTHTSRLASHVSRNSPRVSRLASRVSRLTVL
jgi:D-serine deaminase-like pyridoxal phosphate-dependent protein